MNYIIQTKNKFTCGPFYHISLIIFDEKNIYSELSTHEMIITASTLQLANAIFNIIDYKYRKVSGK